jgi:dynein heavy chain
MKSWGEVSRLSDLKAFPRFYEHFYNHQEFIELKRIYDSLAPQEEPLPASMANYNALHRLCVLRIIRPDKMIPAIQIFVRDTLGEEFIFPPAFNLAEIYKDSSSTTPLIFVLSPGSDPFASLNVFSQQKERTTEPLNGFIN